MQDIAYILKTAKDRNVRFIRLWFTDILGFLKSVAITYSELERVLQEGIGFDGQSVSGFVRHSEHDMVAVPEPDTFRILPWRSIPERGVARVFCSIKHPDGRDYEGDPRIVLRRVLKKAAEQGYSFYVGPEIEFFYFRDSSGRPEAMDNGGYFDLTPLDAASDVRRDTVLLLEEMGVEVKSSHHEGAPSQHEIDLRYSDALAMADNITTFRLVTKEVAAQHGGYATFMPKPIPGANGSGMHVHQSLFRGEENAFWDPDNSLNLSQVGRQFTAGLLRHAREITLVTNQWVNSYKRLIPGYEAPVNVAWARTNSHNVVRLPMVRAGRASAARVEYRSPDSACNPYLAFAVMLAAGLDGIARELELPPQADSDRPAEEQLPRSLDEAIAIAEKCDLLRDVLGAQVLDSLIENKRDEWRRYNEQVTQFEIDNYLPIL